MRRYVHKANKAFPEGWFDQLCSDVNDAIEESVSDINLFVCANIALITMYGIPKCKVDHSMDPSYDHSGILEKTGVIRKSEFKNIRFSDFMEMHNGEQPRVTAADAVSSMIVIRTMLTDGYWRPRP